MFETKRYFTVNAMVLKAIEKEEKKYQRYYIGKLESVDAVLYTDGYTAYIVPSMYWMIDINKISETHKINAENLLCDNESDYKDAQYVGIEIANSKMYAKFVAENCTIYADSKYIKGLEDLNVKVKDSRSPIRLYLNDRLYAMIMPVLRIN